MKKTIFVVDDSISNLTTISEVLSPYYAVRTIPSGTKAIERLEKMIPDIVLLDIEMPEIDGFDVFRHLRNDERLKEIPVIFLTAKKDHETESKALEMGVVDFISKPFNPAVLLNRVKHHIGIAELVRERTAQLYNANRDVVFVLADVVENRDELTGDHLGRTSYIVKILLKRMLEKSVYEEQISGWDFDLMSECSLLHDVGKIKVADTILKKPGKLTSEEYDIMKSHAVYGENIIETIIARSGGNVFLHNAKLFAVSHHEHWDGKGYPYGLSGEDIPLQGRIMAIADVFDALMSKRIYKEEFPAEQALEIIASEKGKHFDPKIVEAFFDVKEEICRELYDIVL
ncbi:MAG: response regulator [Oscillospiraceae bacterium]|nr:response regulator [Oscillospiraceae bacterium]